MVESTDLATQCPAEVAGLNARMQEMLKRSPSFPVHHLADRLNERLRLLRAFGYIN